MVVLMLLCKRQEDKLNNLILSFFKKPMYNPKFKNHIYFLQYASKQKSPIKIGISKNIKQRKKQISQNHPYKINLIGEIKNIHEDVESTLHLLFFDNKLKHEWFKYTTELFITIDKINTIQNNCNNLQVWVTDEEIYKIKRKEYLNSTFVFTTDSKKIRNKLRIFK